MQSLLIRLVLGAWVCACWFTVSVSAQDAPTTSFGLAQAGYKAYQDGKYQEAAALLEQLLQKFGTSEEAPNAKYLLGLSYYSLGKYAEGAKALADTKGIEEKFVPIAQFHYGVCLYLTGEYDKAYPQFDAVVKSSNKEMQPYAMFYYALAKLDQAKRQPAAAKQVAADGAAKIDALIAAYPDSDIIPDAIMTKANLFSVSRDFAQAAQVLNELKARPESKDLELDIDLQLGFTYTQQAKALRDEYKKDEAAEAIDKAREVYTRLAANDNLTLANSAAFQLADLEFDAALVSPAETREAAFQKAIDAYRSLKSKEDLIAAQTKIVQNIRDEIGKSAADKKRVTALTRQLQREEAKLAGLQNSADQATSGLIRIGDSYQRMAKYDEARIVYRAALPTTADEQAANLNAQIIITYALQGQSQKAEDAYAKFKQEHANDPNASAIPYFIGIAFLQEQKYDEAIQKFDQLLKDFPTSPYAVRIPQVKATAYQAQGKTAEALKGYDDFIADATSGKIKVDPEELDNAKLLRSYALATAKKVPEAIAAFQEVAEKARNPKVRAEAALCAGDYLNNSAKYDQAIETFQNFIKNFPDDPKASTAAYSIGWACEGQKKYAEAIAAYQDAIEKYSDDKATQLKCYERVWRVYLAQNDYAGMVKAQDAQIAAFPASERNMTAYVDRGKYLEEHNQPLEEIVAAYLKVTDAYNALPAGMKAGDGARLYMKQPAFAMLKLVGIYLKEAAKLGAADALADDKLAAWKDCLDHAYQYADIALQQYNQAQGYLGSELQNMNKIQLQRIKAKLTTVEDATTYLSKLAGVLNNKADAAQIMIARAAFVYELGNKTQAMNFYKEAFASVSKPTDISWQDYDRYGSILLDNKNWADAKQVFETLQSMYQGEPPDPKQKGVYDRANAAATYGLGAVETGLGNAEKAGEYFTTLKEKYPWSEKLLNADYQRGLAQAGQGNYDEAFKIWKAIMASTANNNEIKSRTMISFAQTLIEMGDKKLTTDEIKTKDNQNPNIYEVAAQYGLKSYFFYPDEPSSPEGLCLAIQTFSQKLNRKADAKKWFDTLSQKYPTSPWTAKAQGML